MLNMPEMGRASDEEIAYLPETELINAAKQFRWIVETAISSARVQTLSPQPMPTRTPPPAQGPMPARTPPPVRTPVDWEPPAPVPAGPLADDEPDQELDIEWQAYMMEDTGCRHYLRGVPEGKGDYLRGVPEGKGDTGSVLGILDSACTRTCHGSEWGDAYRSFLTDAGLAWEELQADVAVRGIGGRVQCTPSSGQLDCTVGPARSYRWRS